MHIGREKQPLLGVLHVKINTNFSPLESQCANLLKNKTGFIKPTVSC